MNTETLKTMPTNFFGKHLRCHQPWVLFHETESMQTSTHAKKTKHTADYLRVYIIRWPILHVLSNGFFKVGYRLPVVTLAHEEAANINFQTSSIRSNRIDHLLNGYCTLIAVSKWQEKDKISVYTHKNGKNQHSQALVIQL